MKNRYRPLLLCAVLLAAACDEPPTGSGDEVEGRIAFNYSGGRTGSYQARGAVKLAAGNQPVRSGSWAAGVAQGNVLEVVGFHQQGGATTADLTVLRVVGAGSGPFTISADCDPEGTATCASVVALFGVSIQGNGMDGLCYLTTGTVSVTGRGEGEARGTFSGEGPCFTTGGEESEFAVTNGSFHVPLLQGVVIEP